MARRGGSGVMRVTLEGNLERANRIPGWIDHAQRRQLERAGDLIEDDVEGKAPGGPGGSIARSVRTRTLSDTRLELVATHPGAKALERGAFIRSNRGRGTAIRFEEAGRTVFVRSPRGVRLPALGWFKKGLRQRRRRIREAFDEAFDDLERTASR